jgi:hypothetical protein
MEKKTMKAREANQILMIVLFVAGIVALVACQGGQTRQAEDGAELAADAQEQADATDVPEQGEATEPTLDDRAAELDRRERELDERAAEIEREKAARPKFENKIVTLPASTVIPLEFLDTLSSETSKEGDVFNARIATDVVVDGMVVIPMGTPVDGRVTQAADSKRIGGRAKLGLEFQRATMPSGEEVPIYAHFADAAKSQTGKDAATIGGATAGGAILGNVLGGDDKQKSTLIGAAVGAAVGTAVAAETKGQAVVIEQGTVIDIVLDRPAQVTVKVPVK